MSEEKLRFFTWEFSLEEASDFGEVSDVVQVWGNGTMWRAELLHPGVSFVGTGLTAQEALNSLAIDSAELCDFLGRAGA